MATRLLLVVLVGLACGDDAAELEPEAGELGAEQTAPPAALDCRPVRRANCSAWNDRACFNVPPECASEGRLPSGGEYPSADAP